MKKMVRLTEMVWRIYKCENRREIREPSAGRQHTKLLEYSRRIPDCGHTVTYVRHLHDCVVMMSISRGWTRNNEYYHYLAADNDILLVRESHIIRCHAQIDTSFGQYRRPGNNKTNTVHPAMEQIKQSDPGARASQHGHDPRSLASGKSPAGTLHPGSRQLRHPTARQTISVTDHTTGYTKT